MVVWVRKLSSPRSQATIGSFVFQNKNKEPFHKDSIKLNWEQILSSASASSEPMQTLLIHLLSRNKQPVVPLCTSAHPMGYSTCAINTGQMVQVHIQSMSEIKWWEGKPALPQGSHGFTVADAWPNFTMFDQVTPWKCIHFEIEMGLESNYCRCFVGQVPTSEEL